MKKYLFLLFVIVYQLSFACLNYSVVGTDIHGNKVETDSEMFPYFQIRTIDKKQYEKFAKNDLKEYKESHNINYYINYATSLVYLGEYKEAISIFQEIDKKQPNTYEVASNLGTAYELIGDNKNALIWIEKALKLNTESHHGSEWIHVSILKKKLGLITSDNILNLDFGGDEIPITKLNKQELQELVNDLTYQLSERTQFVKPKEAIVARLYFDLGNALALNLDLESALKAYHLSKEYGNQSIILEKRMKYFQNLINENDDSGKQVSSDSTEDFKLFLQRNIITISLIVGLFLFLVFIVIKKLRK